MPTTSRESGSTQSTVEAVEKRVEKLRDSALAAVHDAQSSNARDEFIAKHSIALSVASAIIGFAATLIVRRVKTAEARFDGKIDFVQLVNGAADRFEKWHHIRVDAAARDALIWPAIPHTDSVVMALKSGEITIKFLDSSILSILEHARSIGLSSHQDVVTKESVRAAMQRFCPYVFWC